jgi:hypothetical protein
LAREGEEVAGVDGTLFWLLLMLLPRRSRSVPGRGCSHKKHVKYNSCSKAWAKVHAPQLHAIFSGTINNSALPVDYYTYTGSARFRIVVESF